MANDNNESEYVVRDYDAVDQQIREVARREQLISEKIKIENQKKIALNFLIFSASGFLILLGVGICIWLIRYQPPPEIVKVTNEKVIEKQVPAEIVHVTNERVIEKSMNCDGGGNANQGSSISGNNNNSTSASQNYQTPVIKYNEVCGLQAISGGDYPAKVAFQSDNTKGMIELNFNTFTIQDRVSVFYENDEIFDSGCIGTGRTISRKIKFDGKSKDFEIRVDPNCEKRNKSTTWEISVNCLN